MRSALILLATIPLLAQETAPRHFLGVKTPLTASRSSAAAEIAADYLRSVAPQLGLSTADLASTYIAKQYRTELNGVTHIIYRQAYLGAEVANAEWVINIDRDGRVLNAGGNLYAAPKQTVLPLRSRAQLAARKAVAAVNPELGAKFTPLQNDKPGQKLTHVRFAAGGLASDLEGAPVWFASRGELRAAWKFFVADADRIHRYSVTVADWDQEILRNQPLTYFQSAVQPPRGLVFERESPQPNPNPGVRLTGPPPVVPRTLQSFAGDPIASPLLWTNGLQTAGNNVVAGENLAGIDFIRPVPVEGTNGDFSFPLQLGPGTNPLNYKEAAVTNLFYWMNRAHDLHYAYGFDEAAGNFQDNNFGRGGLGGDPVYAYAHFGARALGAGELENAYFSVTDSLDGGQPEVAMFLSAAPGPNGDFFTDGSYDSYVMVHEYTHGVSTRLARDVYTTFQGAAMGEAWSDFFGQEYTLPNGADPDGIYPAGEYFDQSWGTGGVRSRPYSTNLSVNPLTFANMGHVISFPEVHADGEIWFEALWEVRSSLIKQFGEAEGRKRARQLVIDGMKLEVPASTMVDARDAILLADRVDYKGASQNQLWAAFAKRGLGALAFSDGGSTTHVLPSFDLPSATGRLRFYDSTMVVGEQVRVILEDSNNTQPTALVQIVSSAGDLENIVMTKVGSVYVGAIYTAFGVVAKQNGRIEVAPADTIDAYYIDRDTAPGATLVSATGNLTIPYQATTTANSFTFGAETRLNPGTTYSRVGLPFQFPFFEKRYGTALVYANGLIAFDRAVTTTSCTDYNSLAKYPAIAPLWNPLSLTGSVQANEGLFTSRTADSVTFRWAGENTPLSQTPSAVNFAVTLFNDGRIEFHYGAGNRTVTSSSRFATCGTGPAVGLSNGHDFYTANYVLPTYDNGLTLHLDPPFGAPSTPEVVLLTPKPGDHVQDILTVSGTVRDTGAVLLPLDIYIDNVQRARVSAVGGQFSIAIDLSSLGLSTGVHQLKIRASNGRGSIIDIPAEPLSFTIDGGQSALPVVKIEQPQEGAVITDGLTVTGYAYSPSLRIASVDTLIDGFVFGPTTYGLRRNDICDPLNPKPLNCPAVGFAGTFDTIQAFPPIPDGKHTVQVRVRDQTGRLLFFPSAPVNITVKNGAQAPIVGVITSPASNAQLSGTVTVSGYVYAPNQKITTALLVVDNVSYGAVRLNQPRADVCAGLPNADACPNIGFTIDFDTRRLLNGPHILGIYAGTDSGLVDLFPKLVNGGINVFVQN